MEGYTHEQVTRIISFFESQDPAFIPIILSSIVFLRFQIVATSNRVSMRVNEK